MIPFSVLDLSPIRQGSDAADALRSTLDLARHAERWGYRRFWLAEHHNMTGIASAATAVVIGHVAQGTSSIRVGAGGIMLPNHSPLVIAEQFGTLETLYPGRIDLGLGRAPGTDQRTAAALRRSRVDTSDAFPQDVAELQAYFQDPEPQQAVRAVPGMGLKVPLWILGSSLFGAQLAAVMGLPYAFASHFAPQQLLSALRVYRANFRPSAVLDKPYAMVGLNVFAADTEPEAQKLFTSLLQAFINLRRGRPGQLPPPVDSMDGRITEYELAEVESMLACSIVGNPQQVEEGLRSFIAEVQPDELMVTSQIFDHTARLRSYELLAQAHARLSSGEGASSSAG
ncbi:luciferase family oxidoreductase, group 1 [Myxococcus fulvus]|uniref:Luciferase-like monooxygenase n=1 Tax=Myxococcus fulvus TaxID=33 RepID=A0A511T505_MYXFU|nr:LLM class flavin-dependent oxidoreductase [Myxococcus fulvus]GEN09251.1 alkane 1-monooxygenase [Myxococcus fulvus]SEU16817.1 luciferase family oxidoreductase, group 1 [Myxococcus fulvus]